MIEYRYTPIIAASEKGISGVIIRYGDRANFSDMFTEEFAPDSLTYNDVIVNIQHDRAKPVARLGDSLAIDRQDNGLVANIMPPDTQNGRDAKAMVEARILRGLSMEFRCIKDRWEGMHRIVERAELHGIGIVDTPAYSDSQIEARFKEWSRLGMEYPADYPTGYYY